MNRIKYIEFLNFFKDNGYNFIFYNELNSNLKNQIILRHDVDFSPSFALEMAQIEYENEIKSTYFFLIRNNMYNSLSQKNTEIIIKIKDLGHNISLHFDSQIYEKIQEGLDSEILIFNSLFRENISLISYHRPPSKILENEFLSKKVQTTYDKEFFKDIKYFSDSSGVFRYGNPIDSDEFKRKENMQVLIHPIWWVSEGNDRMSKIEWYKDKAQFWIEDNLNDNLNFYAK